MADAEAPGTRSGDDAGTAPDGRDPVRGGGARVVVTLAWVARAAWVLVAVAGGGAVEAAVDGRSSGVRWVAAVGGWAAFGAVALALLVPSVRSLTVVRVVAPLSIGATIATAVAGAPGLDVALLGVPAVVTVAVVTSAEIGRWMVQASAYGDEDRLPLRAPVAAGAAAVVAWLLWAPCALLGPLALGAQRWVPGVVLTALAVGGAAFLAPRWHRLARRWLVLVPAGLVVHDPVVLADTLMLRTAQVAGVGLAPAGTGAADLTGPASGYALEVTAREQVTTVLAFTPKAPNGTALHLTAFLVAPSRPGAALRLAAARRLPLT